jgi:DNA-binding transcriptional LysR family regulator
MDFSALRTFLTVAAEHSFSRAAEKLGRSQPAVSLAIRRLEEDLGEELFDRRSRGGKLTPAGEVLNQYGPRVLQAADEAVAAVAAVRGARVGRRRELVINAQEWTLAALLPLLDSFQRQHPDVSFGEPPRAAAAVVAPTARVRPIARAS